MHYLSLFDRDHDGMIENESFPDQVATSSSSSRFGASWVILPFAHSLPDVRRVVRDGALRVHRRTVAGGAGRDGRNGRDRGRDQGFRYANFALHATECVIIHDEFEVISLAGYYRSMLERAKAVYEEKLWNGHYYRYDSQSDSIMADMVLSLSKSNYILSFSAGLLVNCTDENSWLGSGTRARADCRRCSPRSTS